MTATEIANCVETALAMLPDGRETQDDSGVRLEWAQSNGRKLTADFPLNNLHFAMLHPRTKDEYDMASFVPASRFEKTFTSIVRWFNYPESDSGPMEKKRLLNDLAATLGRRYEL